MRSILVTLLDSTRFVFRASKNALGTTAKNESDWLAPIVKNHTNNRREISYLCKEEHFQGFGSERPVLIKVV